MQTDVMDAEIGVVARRGFHVLFFQSFLAKIYQFPESFAVVDGETVLEHFFDFLLCFEIEDLLILLGLILHVLDALDASFNFSNFFWLAAFLEQLLHYLLVRYH